MDLVVHILNYYVACHELFGADAAILKLRESVGKICYPDLIRAYIGNSDNTVKGGRAYSHFTDKCGLVYPTAEELKNSVYIDRDYVIHNPSYRQGPLQGDSDLRCMLAHNSRLFIKPLTSWGYSILVHLNQDIRTDQFWRVRCQFDTERNTIIYLESGVEVSVSEFRAIIEAIRAWVISLFCNRIYDKYNITVNETWICENVHKPIQAEFSALIASEAVKYIKLRGVVESNTLFERLLNCGLVVDIGKFVTDCDIVWEQSIVSSQTLLCKEISSS